MIHLVDRFTEALLSLDRIAARQMVEDRRHGMTPIQFVENVIVAALERIGEDWQQGVVALSQVYMGGRICEGIVDDLLPPGAPERKNHPKMAICVLSDQHKLGKTIVYSLLRASGYDLSDYGVVEVSELAHRVKTDGMDILLISVLMLPSALQVKEVAEKLREAGLQVKIIVGGAPFRLDENLWREVGADAMCRSASEALSTIHQVLVGAR